VVVVCGLTPRRRPAKDAVLLYEETEESKRKRETMVAQMQFERPVHLQSIGGRPSKKTRRAIIRFTKGNK
jgi:ribosome-associated heat shock protein Hsp15